MSAKQKLGGARTGLSSCCITLYIAHVCNSPSASSTAIRLQTHAQAEDPSKANRGNARSKPVGTCPIESTANDCRTLGIDSNGNETTPNKDALVDHHNDDHLVFTVGRHAFCGDTENQTSTAERRKGTIADHGFMGNTILRSTTLQKEEPLCSTQLPTTPNTIPTQLNNNIRTGMMQNFTAMQTRTTVMVR